MKCVQILLVIAVQILFVSSHHVLTIRDAGINTSNQGIPPLKPTILAFSSNFLTFSCIWSSVCDNSAKSSA
jgi:hypothetical protein